jgi:predicted ATP-grasp superfamily ATP-dependent carboligase
MMHGAARGSRSPMTPVLVLDANQRSALAATRALGSRGIPVFAADETRTTLAGSSKYCSGTFTLPSPYAQPEPFIAAVQQAVADRGVGVVFPMTDATSYLMVRHRDSFPGIRIPLGSLAVLETLVDKWTLWQLARSLEVPVPRTWDLNGSRALSDVTSNLGFPVVVKPRRSHTWSNGRCIAATVRYAHSVDQLEAMITREFSLPRHALLLQEYVSGATQGVFALYDNGRPLVFFAHRRLRQKPPSGGVSVLSESIGVEPCLGELTRRILDHVGWHGVAMLEFKVAPDGTPYLIEVNPRFWGSLQLAIDAGVNFPFLLYQVALGLAPEPITRYATGIKSRWLLGDLDHLYLTLKGHLGPDFRSSGRWRAIASFLNFFDRTTRYDVGRWNDPGPFVFELRHYLQSTGG